MDEVKKQIIRFSQEEDSTSVSSIFCLPTRLSRVSCPSRGPQTFVAISGAPMCPNLQFRWQFQNKPSTYLQPLRTASTADVIPGFPLGTFAALCSSGYHSNRALLICSALKCSAWHSQHYQPLCICNRMLRAEGSVLRRFTSIQTLMCNCNICQ